MSECVSHSFEPGRLMKQCHDAHIRCMVDNNPTYFERWSPRLQVPVPPSEAAEIFAAMDARFKAWTGMTLAEYLSLPTLEGQK